MECEAEQIPENGGKSGVGNNDLFLIQAKIRRVHWTKWSGRKRTAVTKMGAVMIDTIQKADKSGAK